MSSSRGYLPPTLESSGPTVPPSLPTAWHLMHARPFKSLKSCRPRDGAPLPFQCERAVRLGVERLRARVP